MRLDIKVVAGGEVRIALNGDFPARRYPSNDMQHKAAKSDEGALSSEATKSKISLRLAAGFGGNCPRTQFTKLGRSNVREHVAAMEGEYGKSARFLTLTFPGSTIGAIHAVSRYSGLLHRSIQQWIRDTIPGSAVASVWELQKRGMLHLHILVASHNKAQLRAVSRKWKGYCWKLIKRVSKVSGIDLCAIEGGGSWQNNYRVFRANTAVPRKSLARYMSKYMSKGSGQVEGFPPLRWWSVNCRARQIAAAVRMKWSLNRLDGKAMQRLTREIVRRIYDCTDKVYAYYNPYDSLARYWVAFVKSTDIEILQRLISISVKSAYSAKAA